MSKLVITPKLGEYKSRILGLPVFRLPTPEHLLIAELKDLPLGKIQRVYVWQPSDGTWYAGHAHRTEHKMLVCISGSVQIEVRRRVEVECVTLQRGEALYVSALTWLRLRREEPNTSLMVLSDSEYDRTDYIESWEEYLQALEQ